MNSMEPIGIVRNYFFKIMIESQTTIVVNKRRSIISLPVTQKRNTNQPCKLASTHIVCFMNTSAKKKKRSFELHWVGVVGASSDKIQIFCPNISFSRQMKPF